jgi:hypothetical protein
MTKRVLVLALVLLLPTSVFAQDESHWGVAVSMTPNWKVPDKFKMFFDAETSMDIKSKDFSIGIARGRTLGGDWSVSYVKKSFKDGSFADSTEVQCDNFVPGCFTFGSRRTLRDVTVTGIEAVKFIPFATIKDRVQIGLNVGGGIGSLKGSLDVREFDVVTTCNNQGRCTGRQTETAFTADVKDEDNGLYALPMYPLGKVEIAAGVILAPGLKVRVSGGLDFPGTRMFAITGVYLIGAN